MTDSNNIPKNIELEKALLGGVMVNPDYFSMLPIDAHDFYIRRHGQIWKAYQNLVDKNLAIDILTVQDELSRVDKLEEIGGTAYLAELIVNVVSALHLEDYASIIKDKANRRRAIHIASELVNAAYDEEEEFEAAVYAQKIMKAIHANAGALHIKNLMADFLELVEKRMESPEIIYGMATGYEDFDELTFGLHKGQGLLIAAPPGVGKSMWCMQMAVQLSEDGHAGAFYAMEMANNAFSARVVSSKTKLGTEKYMQGDITDEQYADLLQAASGLSVQPIFYSDKSSWSLGEMRADLTRLKMQNSIEWFFVDYLGLMRNNGLRSEAEEIAFKSEGVLAIARDLDLALVAIHTLTKEGQKAFNPNLTDMRGSGSDYGFDRVWFMVKEENNENIVHFVPGKARHEKPPKTFTMIKSPDYPHFAKPASGYLANMQEEVETQVDTYSSQMDYLHE